MVWSRGGEAERPPLSLILPRLYLGAERDVTQDRLASLGISYVLNVSRCSPRPSFLPHSRYLRIPIDDSLWADLLPWIPQALHFIDAAMSSGASVLVHCAAGISRSPALAVAYIMYSLGMDLDQAYRFVKERRPSISPNFNFLGQLQHFQGTLSQKAPAGVDITVDNHLPSIYDSCPPTGQIRNYQVGVSSDPAEVKQAHTESFSLSDGTQQRHSDGGENRQLSGTFWTLDHKQVSDLSPCEPVKPAPKPVQLQLPTAAVSLLEKRKSLSLSLTPLGVCPPSPASSSQQATTKTVHKIEMREKLEAKTQSSTGSCRQAEEPHGDQSATHRKEPGLLSPLSFTLNKLLGWGERVLLGGVFVHPVRMGQPTLPYRC
ncbi:uncharacterized protein ACBR49_012463 [Aulostomus maculatus]